MLFCSCLSVGFIFQCGNDAAAIRKCFLSNGFCCLLHTATRQACQNRSEVCKAKCRSSTGFGWLWVSSSQLLCMNYTCIPHTQLYMHACMHARTHMHTCLHAHTLPCTCTHVDHTHTYTSHIYTHTHTQNKTLKHRPKTNFKMFF